MGTLGAAVRGTRASALWLGGVPFVNARIALTARTQDDARRLIAAHFARFLATCRISVTVSGTPPARGNACVLCYNESSFADVAAFCTVMWPHIEWAAAADIYAYFPWGRTAARKAGIELVPRGNRAGTDRLMGSMVDAVKACKRIAWGGEGRLSGRDGVARFKIGASLIAIRAQAPIIPVAFYGGHSVMPLGSVRATPGRILVRFGAPIPVSGLTEDDARSLADRTQTVVAGMYADLRNEDRQSAPL
jgi:1-acyl-sn-glycerol-3-phosphate acyltransferase